MEFLSGHVFRLPRPVVVGLVAVTFGVGASAGALLHPSAATSAARASAPIVVVDDPAPVVAAAAVTPKPPAIEGTPTPSAAEGAGDAAGTSADATSSGDTTTAADATTLGSTTPPDASATETGTAPDAAPTAATPTAAPPPIHHVWLISLTGQDNVATFAPGGPARYFRTLARRGTRLTAYTPTAAETAAVAQTLVAQLGTAGTSERVYGNVPGAVGLDRLGPDVATAASAPAFSWVAPGACFDGSTTPCAPGATAGLPAADGFLRLVVPAITASPAYADGGLILVAFAAPETPGAPAPVLLLSPYVRAHHQISTAATPYALLRALEDLFSLAHLGHAGDTPAAALDGSLFTTTPATTRSDMEVVP
jgi:hypothetical protein